MTQSAQSARDPGNEDTVRDRLREYKRREGMIVWVGAGLAGLIALIALGVGDTSDEIPALFRAIAATAVVVSGAALSYARVNFEWYATVIKRKIEDNELQANHGKPRPSICKNAISKASRGLRWYGVV
jgi:hypothetical protein